MGFDRSTGSQDLVTGCGYGKENGVLLCWCVGCCSVSFQSFVLRHFHNTKQLPVVSIQSRFDTSRLDTKSSSEILGEYIRSLRYHPG